MINSQCLTLSTNIGLISEINSMFTSTRKIEFNNVNNIIHLENILLILYLITVL